MTQYILLGKQRIDSPFGHHKKEKEPVWRSLMLQANAKTMLPKQGTPQTVGINYLIFIINVFAVSISTIHYKIDDDVS